MKRLTLPFFVMLLFSCRQPAPSNRIEIGTIDSVYSKVLGEERKIWVYLPAAAKDTSRHFPVLYLLDGDVHFASVSGIVKHMAANAVCPDMIIIGIPNTDRTRDLTPTHSLLFPDGSKSNDLKSSGGGEKFVSFIQNELIPHIDSVYPVAPYKMLIGHSFGGLTVMNILTNHSRLFNAYIAVDPSMWWDKQKLLNQARTAFEKQKFDDQSLFMGIANTMPFGMDTLQVRVDTTGTTFHIRSILLLKDILQHNKSSGLNFGYSYYKNDDHGSSPLITEYDGLHFIFSYYKTPQLVFDQLFDKQNQTDAALGFTEHYREISKRLGYTQLPPEELINGYAGYLQGSGQPLKASQLLQMNIKNYPKSANAYESLGDFYKAQKEKAKAIAAYEKALSLKETSETRKKLDDLNGKK